MAINRAPFNALVDDDGSNLVGTVWNKAAIAGVVLDPVDAALAAVPAVPPGGVLGDLLIKDPAVATYAAKWAPPAWTLIETAAAPSSNWDPGIVGDTVIVLAPSSGVAVTGFRPARTPWVGQRLLMLNRLGRQVDVYFMHASSAPGSQILSRGATAFSLTAVWSFAEFVYVRIDTVGYWFATALGNSSTPGGAP